MTNLDMDHKTEIFLYMLLIISIWLQSNMPFDIKRKLFDFNIKMKTTYPYACQDFGINKILKVFNLSVKNSRTPKVILAPVSTNFLKSFSYLSSFEFTCIWFF